MTRYETTEYEAKALKRLFDKAVYGDNGCMEFVGSTDDHGYGCLRFKGPVVKAHRVSYILLVGDIPPDMNVLHSCDNPPCINPEHLFLGTDADNSQDMINKGRSKSARKGSENGRALVTEADVIEIRRLYNEGVMTISELARRYKLTWRPTQMIIDRITWRHI